ncbi:MAG TPA: hypothetical protein VMW16_14345 [Sedimentisphaerales bacterium]|nr:hypothetical protein [Sedimentisphaerales bacterium]
MCRIKKLVLVSTVTVVSLAGCSASGPAKVGDDAQIVDAVDGMIEHLQRQNLPALKAVETWRNDYGPGLKLTTEHYQVYTTLLDPLMLSQVPGFLESAYRGYNDQMPERIETQTRFPVYLFADRQQWDAFTKTFAGPQAPTYSRIKAGAYSLKGACVAYNIGRERTFSVLGHEGWHQFSSRHFKFRLPSWLDEGIAMLFEVSRYENGLFYFEPGRNIYRLGDLKRTLTEKRMIPLRDLIAMNPGEVLAANETMAVTGFYSQAYALVRFLREEGYGKRLGNYRRLLLDGLAGEWPLTEAGRRIAGDRNIPLTVQWNRAVAPRLFEHYFGIDAGEIEQEYLAFCGKIVYHVHFR